MARPKWGADNQLNALLLLLERRIDAMVTPDGPDTSARFAAIWSSEQPEAPAAAQPSRPPERVRRSDPLADIMALSEEERIALFT